MNKERGFNPEEEAFFKKGEKMDAKNIQKEKETPISKREMKRMMRQADKELDAERAEQTREEGRVSKKDFRDMMNDGQKMVKQEREAAASVSGLSHSEFQTAMNEGGEMAWLKDKHNLTTDEFIAYLERDEEEIDEKGMETFTREALSREEFKEAMYEGRAIVEREAKRLADQEWFYKWVANETGKVGPEERSRLYNAATVVFKEVLFERLLNVENFDVSGLENLEKVPKGKGMLMVVNHEGQLDPQALMVALGTEGANLQLNFVAGQKANFGNELMAKLLLKAGAIPMTEPWGDRFQNAEEHGGEFIDPRFEDQDRIQMAKASIEIAAQRVENGNPVVIFGEGPVTSRGQNEIRRSTRGPGRIIDQMKKNGMNPADIHVVPITINGGSTIAENPINTKPTDFAWKGLGKAGNIEISIGEPLTAEDVESRLGDTDDELQAMSDVIMAEVAKGKPEELRGPYKQ